MSEWISVKKLKDTFLTVEPGGKLDPYGDYKFTNLSEALRGNMTYKNEVLNEREKTHGDYGDTAHIAQGLKEVLHRSPEFDNLDSAQKESMEMFCTKMARIVSGDADEIDHWKDIAGYANLISERLEKPAAPVEIKITERTVIVPGIRVVNEVIEEDHEG